MPGLIWTPADVPAPHDSAMNSPCSGSSETPIAAEMPGVHASKASSPGSIDAAAPCSRSPTAVCSALVVFTACSSSSVTSDTAPGLCARRRRRRSSSFAFVPFRMPVIPLSTSVPNESVAGDDPLASCVERCVVSRKAFAAFARAAVSTAA